MITNERQYRITRRKAADFASAIEEVDARSHDRTDVHPRLLRAELEAMKSQLADLCEELQEYERLEAADALRTPAERRRGCRRLARQRRSA